MEIREYDLFNFMNCPLKYLCYKDNIIEEPMTYNKILHSMFNWLVSEYTYNNNAYLFNRLKDKWDKVCLENKHIISTKRILEGWELVYKMYEMIVYKNYKIIDANIPYRLVFDDYSLVGQVDMAYISDNSLGILRPSLSNTLPETYKIDLDIKNTIDALALKELYAKDSFIIYHSFIYNEDKVTIRSNKDYLRLEKIVKNVGHCIENDIYYPNSGYHCSNCVVRNICSKWGTY